MSSPVFVPIFIPDGDDPISNHEKVIKFETKDKNRITSAICQALNKEEEYYFETKYDEAKNVFKQKLPTYSKPSIAIYGFMIFIIMLCLELFVIIELLRSFTMEVLFITVLISTMISYVLVKEDWKSNPYVEIKDINLTQNSRFIYLTIISDSKTFNERLADQIKEEVNNGKFR